MKDELPSNQLTRCAAHGVMYREMEGCAKCREGAAASSMKGPGKADTRSRLPVVPILVLIAVLAGGAVVAGLFRSGNGADRSSSATPVLSPEVSALTARYEPQLRRIEAALFEGREPGRAWSTVETAILEIVEGLRDARSYPERQSLLELTAFVGNTGNLIEMGGMDLPSLQGTWTEIRTSVFGAAAWFREADSSSSGPEAVDYFYPDRGEPVDATRVASLQDWFDETRRLVGVGQDQARRFAEIGPGGDRPGGTAADRTRSEWRDWLQRWGNSLAGLREVAPPRPLTDGLHVSEYLEVHQGVLATIDRLQALQHETGSYGVPDRERRLAIFGDARRRLAEAAGVLQDLREATR